MKRGVLITFEGPEGAGKTTQIQRLHSSLQRQNHFCRVSREPGGTPLGESIREIVKFHQGEEPLFDVTELLLFSASRSQHVRYLIEPAIANGEIVLCDRFTDSTLAYQGYGRGLELAMLRNLNELATGSRHPDLTILLDIPPEQSFQRLQRRAEEKSGSDRIENAGYEFHEKVRNGFLSIAAAEPERIKVIDGMLAADEIQRQIEALVHAII